MANEPPPSARSLPDDHSLTNKKQSDLRGGLDSCSCGAEIGGQVRVSHATVWTDAIRCRDGAPLTVRRGAAGLGRHAH